MRQRVAFLRTLLADKPVLLLDEPFGALDAITRAELQEWLLAALAAEPRTVMLVTHDVEEALLLCERVVVLAAGRVTAAFDVDVVRDAPRREIVTNSAFIELREQALEAIG
jgi:NitT/TauT family transport system ATP-binding protein